MWWIKVIFVVVTVNRLDSLQIEESGSDDLTELGLLDISTATNQPIPKCKHKAPDIQAFGCRTEHNLTLSFNNQDSIQLIETVTDPDRNCYKFDKNKDSFVANIHDSNNVSLCNYNVFVTSSKPNFYLLQKSNLESISICPNNSEVCVQSSEVTSAYCPIKNFTVTPKMTETDAEKYIILHLSWNKVDKKDDQSVLVKIIHKTVDNFKRHCNPKMYVFNHSLNDNHIKEPDMVTEQEVIPGCTYEINIVANNNRDKQLNCTYIYTLPERVADKWDCDRFRPTPKILSVDHIAGDTFLVMWDPGERINNDTQVYTTKKVEFKYLLSKKTFYAELAKSPKTNLKQHTSEISMKLLENENYTLIGTFHNNFSCSTQAKFSFTVPGPLDISTATNQPIPKCKHKAPDIQAFGCRTEHNLTLSFNNHDFIELIETVTDPDSNCYKFDKNKDSFVANIHDSNNVSFCNYDVLVTSSNPNVYLLQGSSLESISICPNNSEVCVQSLEGIPAYCPIKNFTVTPEMSESDVEKYINLHLSWNKVDKKDDRSVLVKILHKIGDNFKRDCNPEMHVFNHSLNDNHIKKPDMVTQQEVNPGCTYEITIDSNNLNERLNCTYIYTLPECVENKCDCDRFRPTPQILSVDHISGDKFLVKWDPGKMTNNDTQVYTTKKVDFKYLLSGKKFELYAELVKRPKSNFKQHTSEISMQLFENENYTLTGTFHNNFSCSTQAKFSFTAPKKSNYNVTIFILLSLIALACLAALSYKKLPKYVQKIRYYISPNYRTQFRLSELSRLQAGQIPMNTNIQYIPVEILDGALDEYEFPRNKIIIKEIIGSGAFGQVYSAKAIGIGGIEGYRMVAVKTLGQSEMITKEATMDFIAEIEIFKKIGRHPNIVALLGCCTIDTPYMMIMEFVPCGDLKNYLLELRKQWLKRKNISNTKQIFFPPDSTDSDGAYITAPTPTTPVSITSSRLPSTSETINTLLEEDPMTPLLAHYTQVLDKVLDDTELQNFALQIAKGMAHLEKICVTHRDLAARNILINEFKTLKISDFGLSRSGPYINHKTKKLPLRWMAIEAIVDQKYDSKSDVWSFGIVLWEIGTLGAFPYENVPDSFVQQFLQMGRRLERPEICTDELYSLMTQCWAANPDQRPSFHELVDALDVKKRKIYVNFNQLNPMYVFPPSEIERHIENPVRIVDISI